LYDPKAKETIVALAPTFDEDKFWEWTDELEEPGVDVESLDLMEPVDFDPNDLLRAPTDQADSPRAGPEENQAQERPQETEEDVVQSQGEADDGLRPQGAVEDEDPIVVDTGLPVDDRNDL
jgi:hypothetical protein